MITKKFLTSFLVNLHIFSQPLGIRSTEFVQHVSDNGNEILNHIGALGFFVFVKDEKKNYVAVFSNGTIKEFLQDIFPVQIIEYIKIGVSRS